jgi:hypothetical protein
MSGNNQPSRDSASVYGLLLAEAPELMRSSLKITESTPKIWEGEVYLDTVDGERLKEAYFVPAFTNADLGPEVEVKEKEQQVQGLLLLRFPSS